LCQERAVQTCLLLLLFWTQDTREEKRRQRVDRSGKKTRNGTLEKKIVLADIKDGETEGIGKRNRKGKKERRSFSAEL